MANDQIKQPVASADRLQEGIFFRPQQTAPPYLRILLVNARPGARPAEIESALGEVVAMLLALRDSGDVRDLRPTRAGERAVPVPTKTFVTFLGYGARFFDPEAHEPALTAAGRPDFLTYLVAQGAAFSSIPWKPDAGAQIPGEADFCLHFNGMTESAINRAAIEVWKLIVDQDLPLETVGSYSGFKRDDGRSWIDFHDGLSNIESSQRLAALESGGDPGWNAGGTYMAFLRLEVDIAAWRRLSREEQEIIVGRDKLSGCPLERVERTDGRLSPKTFPGCSEAEPSTPADRRDYFDPPQTSDPLLEASHIHRANQNRAAPTTPASQRIFRQGYEFLDAISADGPRLGLNFVSFQKDLERLQQVLGLSGWLGDVNFGGPTEPKAGEPSPLVLMRLLAGGFYAVPPRDEPFPGVELLGQPK